MGSLVLSRRVIELATLFLVGVTISLDGVRLVAANEPPVPLGGPCDAATAKKAQAEWAKYLGHDVTFENSIGIKLVVIPPGQFTMGSPVTEPGRDDDETLHNVKITRPFVIGAYPITQSEYEKVMGVNPSGFCQTGSRSDKVEEIKTDRFPVERVSWQDAVEFCRKLSDLEREKGKLKEGFKYTLPTEAQWEYACRAGTRSAFNVGNSLSPNDANFIESRVGRPVPVGKFKPNSWGLYDMHGNVWQMCADLHDAYPSSPTVDPSGPSSKGRSAEWARVWRGGAWNAKMAYCRSACRNGGSPDDRGHDETGFRVVLVSESR